MTEPISIAHHMDCMEFMATLPDGFADLAIVDPPYGIGAGGGGIGNYARRKHQKKDWDGQTPTAEYWDELFRVSKNQIVCGANYFIEHLYSTKSFICWVKNNPAPCFAEAELLWTSLDVNGKVFDNKRQIQHQILLEGGSLHPTQKPIALYAWLLKNYASLGDKILDTHLGSGSSRIAAYDAGFDFWSTEKDADYFRDQEKRFAVFKSQPKLFQTPRPEIIQTSLEL